jgi:hypothetical protein
MAVLMKVLMEYMDVHARIILKFILYEFIVRVSTGIMFSGKSSSARSCRDRNECSCSINFAASLVALEEGQHSMEFGWLIAVDVWLVD